MMPTIRRLAPVGLLLATACNSDEPGTPAVPESASVAISLRFPDALASSTGLREGYLKTNRLYVQFRDPSRVREERQVEFQPTDGESRYPMYVRLRAPRETLLFNLEVRLGDAAVFRGETPVTLRAGRLTEVTTTLIPVLAGVRAPDSVPEITAWGDTRKLTGAGILATGDTIEGVPIDWSSLDPAVATIAADGTVTGLQDGIARVVATADAFSDTASVRVHARVASVVVTPPRASIPLRSSQQYSVALFDSRGNQLPPLPVSWSSSDPAIVSIDQTGLATAVGIGTVMINAGAGTANSEAEATGVPIAPVADSLTAVATGQTFAVLSAVIIPNGAATQAWFEWGSAQAPTPPSVIAPVPVGAGLLSVPVNASLSNLTPNTLYYAVARAASAAGSAMTDTLWFATGKPTSSLPPKVVTEGWTPIQPGLVVLIGSVETGGIGADTWFEWGTDPALQNATRTSLTAVSGFGKITVTAPVQLPKAGTYYFRFVGTNQNGTGYGAILSLTFIAPREPATDTQPATNITHEGATLNGTVNPNGLPTTAWFDWGTDPSLNTFTSTTATDVGPGSRSLGFSFGLIALSPNTTYYFRSRADNNMGSNSGSILSFTTLYDPNIDPPDIMTDPATVALEEPVILNGTVNPNGSATTVWFEWGVSSDPSTFTATGPQSAGAGSAPASFSASLPAGTTGYYRAAARNDGGTVYGSIIQF